MFWVKSPKNPEQPLEPVLIPENYSQKKQANLQPMGDQKSLWDDDQAAFKMQGIAASYNKLLAVCNLASFTVIS